jgi:hypothetical protein
MKKLNFLFLALCLTLSNLSSAQNPFESIGKKSKPMLTLSDGKYIEYFNNDSVRQIGSAMVNVYTEQIVAFVDRKEQAKKIHAQTSSRFLSLDPLARSFPWNSPYSYAENRPIDGIDLDGREWSKTQSFDPKTGITTVNYTVKIKVTSFDKNYADASKSKDLINGISAQFKKTYTQFDKSTNTQYNADVQLEFPAQGEKSTATIDLSLVDNPTESIGGSTGMVGGNTQNNSIVLPTSRNGLKRPLKFLIRRAVHEIGHSGGLPHPWETNSPEDVKQPSVTEPPKDEKMKETIKSNIMNSDGNNASEEMKTNSGKESTPGQLKQIGENIDNDAKAPK